MEINGREFCDYCYQEIKPVRVDGKEVWGVGCYFCGEYGDQGMIFCDDECCSKHSETCPHKRWWFGVSVKLSEEDSNDRKRNNC